MRWWGVKLAGTAGMALKQTAAFILPSKLLNLQSAIASSGRPLVISHSLLTSVGSAQARRECVQLIGLAHTSDSASAISQSMLTQPSTIEERIERMLSRKIDLWPAEEIMKLLPTLLKGEELELAIDAHLSDDTTSVADRRRLQYSRDFLSSLKYSEQQRLAKQWIESLLEAVTMGPEAMDGTVQELLQYEDKALVEPVLESLRAMRRRLEESSPEEKTLTQVVVQTIQDRIEAEVKTQDKPFLRLLALLLRVDSPGERERILRMELRSSRSIANFAAFLEEGAEYMARLRLGPYRLADDTPEKMGEILKILGTFVRPVEVEKRSSPIHQSITLGNTDAYKEE